MIYLHYDSWGVVGYLTNWQIIYIHWNPKSKWHSIDMILIDKIVFRVIDLPSMKLIIRWYVNHTRRHIRTCYNSVNINNEYTNLVYREHFSAYNVLYFLLTFRCWTTESKRCVTRWHSATNAPICLTESILVQAWFSRQLKRHISRTLSIHYW